MNRRDLIRGGLAAGVTLAVPARALADDLTRAFDGAFGNPFAAKPALTVPATPIDNSAYQRKILQIAQREVHKAGARVWRRDVAGIADFAQSSAQPRFHFANLENGTVRSFYVAHGRGSDPAHCGWLQSFSNEMGSNATSRGAYLTCEWYNGKYGTSIRLEGLDRDNSQALSRAIVMHPASYAAPSMIATYGKLGRSEGCFAMAPEQFNEALWHLSGGRLLYADRIGEA
ncbi:MAG: twin-arginine translocation pathway signal [Novosphingobium sp.]|nr:twin-arginine translocation pathway signal [Novosphingobium sp.]